MIRPEKSLVCLGPMLASSHCGLGQPHTDGCNYRRPRTIRKMQGHLQMHYIPVQARRKRQISGPECKTLPRHQDSPIVIDRVAWTTLTRWFRRSATTCSLGKHCPTTSGYTIERWQAHVHRCPRHNMPGAHPWGNLPGPLHPRPRTRLMHAGTMHPYFPERLAKLATPWCCRTKAPRPAVSCMRRHTCEAEERIARRGERITPPKL